MDEPAPIDHRSRVAGERRERMRARLLDSALEVFATSGGGSSAIQQVISTAKVSQGTFYNYFRTSEELMGAVSESLNNELMRVIEAEVGEYADAAERIACGLRLYLHAALAYPLFARFVSTAGLHAAGPNNLIYEYLPPHITLGLQAGRFDDVSVEEALDLIAGTVLTAVYRLSTGEAPAGYPERIVAAILRGLGMTAVQARKLTDLPLKGIAVGTDSLLERSNRMLHENA